MYTSCKANVLCTAGGFNDVKTNVKSENQKAAHSNQASKILLLFFSALFGPSSGPRAE